MARPTKLTPALHRLIVKAVRMGNTREVAAAAAGIAPSTLYNWLAAGQAAKTGRLMEFSETIKAAEAQAVMASVGVIRHAARSTWQAAAWWLERRYPDEWGRKDRVLMEHLLETESERIARDLGLSKEDVLADAARILAGSR